MITVIVAIAVLMTMSFSAYVGYRTGCAQKVFRDRYCTTPEAMIEFDRFVNKLLMYFIILIFALALSAVLIHIHL